MKEPLRKTGSMNRAFPIRIRGGDKREQRQRISLSRLRAAMAWRRPSAEGEGMLVRFREDGSALSKSVFYIYEQHSRHRRLESSAMWILENSRFILEEIRKATRDLKMLERQRFPQSAISPHGSPNPYLLRLNTAVAEYAAEGRQVNAECLNCFLATLQKSFPLSLRELWAVPAVFRVVYITLLRQLVDQVVQRMQGLYRHGSDISATEERIAEILKNLRAESAIDWREIIEEASAVERLLRSENAGVYKTMDFATRDYYRKAIEDLAERSGATAETVTRQALVLAKEEHVGCCLFGSRRAELERQIGYKPSWRRRLGRVLANRSFVLYTSGFFAIWFASITVFAWILGRAEFYRGSSFLVVASVIALFAAASSQFTVSLLNWICTVLVPPRPVMRLDFSNGIPNDCQTLVVVPAILATRDDGSRLARDMELRFLSNRDENVSFALLTDLADSRHQYLQDDEVVVQSAVNAIRQLNRRWGPKFFLLHRARIWNSADHIWTSDERKRGKLAALNQFIVCGRKDSFETMVGEIKRLRHTRYAITLDSDTRLPMGAARKLVATIAHPLNRPVVDAERRRIRAGHAIFQPRVSCTIPDANRSPYSRMLAGEAGIDPYTKQTSDVYQDIFDEGSFIGKGIYDVAAVECVLAERFPKNRILSHDLIEGCYCRSGLVSDIEIHEGVPSKFIADMRRLHRWIRGDWQIASWILPRVPFLFGRERNPLNLLSRLKIFDNLRRNVAIIALFAFLIVSILAASQISALCIAAAVVLTLGVACLSHGVLLFRRPAGTSRLGYSRKTFFKFLRALLTEFASLSVLPFVAYLNIDAAVRALYRMSISRSMLLEWTTSSQTEQTCCRGLKDYYMTMWPCWSASMCLFVGVVTSSSLIDEIFVAVLTSIWLASPYVMWRLSRASKEPTRRLTGASAFQARIWARKSWRFFETLVNAENNWLPPDHARDNGKGDWIVEARTSPTNIGMAILADLGAYDLGYIPVSSFLDRLSLTFETLGRLERYRGHFFNWYNIRSLTIEGPRYVSTVDSGNLWGALVVAHSALIEFHRRDILPTNLIQAFRDMIYLAIQPENLEKDALRSSTLDIMRAQLSGAEPHGARDVLKWMNGIRRVSADLRPIVRQPAIYWLDAIDRMLDVALRGIGSLAFWLSPEVEQHGSILLDGDRKDLTVLQQRILDNVRAWIEDLDRTCSTCDIVQAVRRISIYRRLFGCERNGGERFESLLQDIERAALRSSRLVSVEQKRICELRQKCRLLSKMDFEFLYDKRQRLFSIGYNKDTGLLDESRYDLLASESRLTSYLAIGDGQVPVEHWFALGRRLTSFNGRISLLSWSGSLFEFLMPLLFMPSLSPTLLDASYRTAVLRHIRYGKRHGVPWGVSESSYNVTDAAGTYQYKAFGAAELGLRERPSGEIVIAPYASAMALGVCPVEASKNLVRLEKEGFLTEFGFIDAIDYSNGRGSKYNPGACRVVMSHHNGMSMVAFCDSVLGDVAKRRFMKNRFCRSAELLLQERIPDATIWNNSRPLHRGFEGLGASVVDFVRVFQPLPFRKKPTVEARGY